MPLNLRVYPLTLPSERHLLVTEWFSTSRFQKHHQVDGSDPERFSRMLGVYARSMAEHRQNVFRLGLDAIESRRGVDAKLEFDFSRFDKLAQVFWDTGRMDALETGFIARFGKGGWSGSEILLDEFRVKDADGRRASVSGKDFLPQFLPAFIGHLRAKGWLAKTLFHICDEPSDHNVIAFRAASDFLHGLAPELRRMDAIETPHWGFNEWTDDPINQPGEHRGDGWHVYPKPGGLLDSLRWEQMRNGLQDYECLWLLESKTAQFRASLPARVAAFIDPRQRGVEIASRVVADYYQHTGDPEVLYRARHQAIEETLALAQSPRVLLQTTPFEHSPVARGCAVDLHGWAQPGTILTANGEPIPVAADGLFLAQVPPSVEGRIVLEAREKDGKREIIRQFRSAGASAAQAGKPGRSGSPESK